MHFVNLRRRRWGKNVVMPIVVFLLSAAAGLHAAEPLVLHAPSAPIPRSYFGLHIHRATTGTVWPEADFGSWRLWDTTTQWSALEPQKGKWDFSLLDKLVALGEQHHKNIMLTLGQTPTWSSSRPAEKSGNGMGAAAPPINLADWREYVRTVGTRYKGRIHAYEIWNEPNLSDFYIGSVEQMVELTNVASAELKKVDPTIIVVTPSVTGDYGVGWLTKFLQAGGARNADAIGYHFYVSPKDPEASLDIIFRVQDAMRANGAASKPLWDTEFGYAVANKTPQQRPEWARHSIYARILSEDEASALIERTLILNWAAGIQRVFWYAFDNGYMGMTEPDGKTPKKNAHAYAVVQSWLEGARMGVCADHAGALWECTLALKNGTPTFVAWSPRGTTRWQIPPQFHPEAVIDMQGVRRPFHAKSLEVGISPVLVEGHY
jgi:hypothetical protein